MTYTITALAVAVCYTAITVWAARTVCRQRNRYGDWPIIALLGFAAASWAAWYWYLLVVQPYAGGWVQILNRTIHAPTVVLLVVALAWRARRP